MQFKGAQSAWDMLQEEETLVRFTTSCADLDNIFGRGISCKEVAEIVNVQIPYDYGGLGGKVVYITTEGSFMVERASQIAEACADDMAGYSCLY
ncbi:RAS associated with diabetes protein 51C [Artemisia annua]|uniref:RAS associated with diabetes protein 51C n=1 Tax=Artemisia annua TaxID=35608 RepID=A0A2U1MTT0_ARTAN|nr:RAS associated with diabetes protein 51C [Artemisia annua]